MKQTLKRWMHAPWCSRNEWWTLRLPPDKNWLRKYIFHNFTIGLSLFSLIMMYAVSSLIFWYLNASLFLLNLHICFQSLLWCHRAFLKVLIPNAFYRRRNREPYLVSVMNIELRIQSKLPTIINATTLICSDMNQIAIKQIVGNRKVGHARKEFQTILFGLLILRKSWFPGVH